MPVPPPKVPSEHLETMRRALWHAVAKEYAAAAAEVNRLGAADPDLIPHALIRWIDTALHASGVDTYGGETTGIAWVAEESGAITLNADAMTPATRWAGRLFACRINDDEPGFRALLASVASDEEWAAGCLKVLLMAASTIRSARAGRPVGIQVTT